MDGVGGGLNKWLEDFLTNGEMTTIIRYRASSLCPVIAGVQQESLLAPVIFVVYIND